MNNVVSALVVSGSDLYAGGQFTTAGGITARYIARWNGSNWLPLGSGVASPFSTYVSELAVSGSDLYVGGAFTTAGGIATKNIAKWDGSSWSALGSGISGTVLALAASGSVLYAGGYFITPSNGIAKWNGNSWSELGPGIAGGDPGLSPDVTALAVLGSDLYAGGRFTTAGGTAANHIAKWNGSSWSALGSGLNDFVWALAISDSDLYAGGAFTTAGGKVSAYVAKAIINPVEFSVVPGSLAVSNGFFQALLSGPVNATVIIETSTTLTNWTPVATNTLPDGGWQISFPTGTDARGFYRVRSQ